MSFHYIFCTLYFLADIISTINTEIAQESYGRLFAVVYLQAKQWRVTEGDIIMPNGTYHLALGQKIKLEKVRLI